MGKKRYLLLFGAVLTLLLCLSLVEASTDKKQLNFENVLAGSTAQQTITITSGSESAKKVEIDVSNNLKDIVDIFPKNNLLIAKNIPLTLEVNIQPDNLLTKDGEIYFYYKPEKETSISSLEDSFDTIKVKFSATNEKLGEIDIERIEISKAETKGLTTITLTINNQANHEKEVTVNLEVEDLLKQFTFTIPAYFNGEKYLIIPTDFKIGNHLAKVSVYEQELLLKKEELNLEIVGGNVLTKKISILGAFSETNSDITKVTTILENMGEAILPITIKQLVYQDEELVLEQEIKDLILNGEKKRILTLEDKFSPGEYKIETVVYYANTFTDMYEKELIIEDEEGVPLSAGIWVVLMSLIILTLFVKSKKWKSRSK